MNISLENIDKVSAVLTIKMEKADYAERVEKALKDYRRKASLPGFRPGQVPMALLKKRFGKEITAEEVNKLLGEKLYAYIKDNKLNILGEPLPSEGRQQNIDFDTMEEFSFAFDIALAPEFKAELGAEDTVDYYDIQVDDKMVDNQVKMFAQRGGSYETVDSYEPKDMVKGLLAELDENGNTKEGGIQVENAVLLPEYMKDDEQKAIFNGCKVNDVVVFNYPCPRKWRQIEMDVKLYYVKRCVALPGDTLRIVDGRYRVSGWLHDLGNVEAQDRLNRMVTEGLLPDSSGVVAAYPDRKTGWTVTEFGPLYLPRAGDRIRLDDRSVRLYRNVIEWEQGRKLTRTERGDILLGDSLVHTYSFLKSYYFVAGDRATDSRDSRYWGLLPEEYIVGRAVRIWKSIDPLTGKTRWDRVWKKIE